MSSNNVRFHSFILNQKSSVQKMSISRLLDKLDRTRTEIYVKDERALRYHLNNILFERSLGVLSNKR
ncbi:MAG: hypothetical protein MASP_01768 [Candidatus Methanolliviera sp. GoM_asphalt]|nr:MAG: hypothetical protein MASP_01768 [Candidatus Methanolliviera sp. GoM_asphalt]